MLLTTRERERTSGGLRNALYLDLYVAIWVQWCVKFVKLCTYELWSLLYVVYLDFKGRETFKNF